MSLLKDSEAGPLNGISISCSQKIACWAQGSPQLKEKKSCGASPRYGNEDFDFFLLIVLKKKSQECKKWAVWKVHVLGLLYKGAGGLLEILLADFGQSTPPQGTS